VVPALTRPRQTSRLAILKQFHWQAAYPHVGKISSDSFPPTVVHTPTGAEFIPQVGDSVIVWKGTLDRNCPVERFIGTATCSI
jgi:hypothetical protein